MIAVCAFSYTRGTLGISVGRTCGSTLMTAYGFGQNAIVKPEYAPQSAIRRPKLCASGR